MSFIDRIKEDGFPSSGLSGSDLWALVIARAMCSRGGVDPDQWYPISVPAHAARREAANAIAVCTACLVRTHCLELSLRYWEVGQHGVWGGTVAADRADLRRKLSEREAAGRTLRIIADARVGSARRRDRPGISHRRPMAPPAGG
jgi:hypothetical protein